MNETSKTNIASLELSGRTRAANLERMRRDFFDLAVIGGGITGAGVALDAASRGLSVALVERRDFASGTSSRSSKLIHGGLRYLERFHLGLVRESLHERAVLSRMAPHLSKPLEFLVPVYTSTERSPLGTSRLRLAAGLTLYDLLAGGQNIGGHRWLSPEDALDRAPALDPQGLRGAFIYYDCLTDDARLVIEVVKTAAAHGAIVSNYAGVRGFHKDDSGRIVIHIDDAIGNSSFDLSATAVVNATGVWADEVSQMADTNSPMRLRPSKGIHIVVPSDRLKHRTAILIPSVGENRFLFVIPWQGRIVIGTTDTDYQGNLDDPRAGAEEVDRVVQSAARAFPGAQLSTADVISAFAGLRPLINSGSQSTKELSRKEEIFEDKLGLITITGGKLTTWRKMAERVVDLVAPRIKGANGARRSRIRGSVTETIELAGGSVSDNRQEECRRAAAECGVDRSTVEHLMTTYGGNYREVLELMNASDHMKRILVDGLPHTEAEVAYAARCEMALKVEDFLSRRSRIELLAVDHGSSCAARVAQLLAAS